MEMGFKFHWVLMGAAAVFAGKIIAGALVKYANFSM
jgi:hypothetical protein